MPERIEHSRLVELQRPYDDEAGQLFEQIKATPAQTSEGKAEKFLVLLYYIMPDDWREHDGVADYEIKQARNLIFELIGGEPAAQLREQFAA
jgi:hypothetical protein